MTAIITRNGTVMKRVYLLDEVFQQIKSDLTLTFHQEIRDLTIHQERILYKISKPTSGPNAGTELIIVPRGYAWKLPMTIKNSIPTSAKCMFKQAIIPEKHQVPIIERLTDELTKYSTALLDMGTGQGKSYVAAQVMINLSVPTLIVVDRDFLAQQWLEDVLVRISPDAKKLTKKMIDKGAQALPNVGIILIQSAIKYAQTLIQKYVFVVYDEVHEYTSEIRSEVFWKLSTNYTMGMSGTLHDARFRGVYISHLARFTDEPNIVVADEISGLDKPKFNVHVHKMMFRGHEDHIKWLTGALGTLDYDKMCKQVMNDPTRRAALTSLIRQVYQDGVHMFVFTSRKAHARQLCVDLADLEPILLVGGAGRDDHMKAKSDASRTLIICNYQYLMKSFSVKRMNHIILALPRVAQTAQVIGRILRLGSDITQPRHVYDIVDTRTGLARQYKTRKNIYKQLDATIDKRRI